MKLATKFPKKEFCPHFLCLTPVFSCGKAAVSLVLLGSLFSFLFCDADWRQLVGFGSTNRPVMNIMSPRSFHSAIQGTTQSCINICWDLCEVGNQYDRFAVVYVSPPRLHGQRLLHIVKQLPVRPGRVFSMFLVIRPHWFCSFGRKKKHTHITLQWDQLHVDFFLWEMKS